jgi:hypothetical protein
MFYKTDPRDMPKPTAVVLKFSEPLSHEGYTLWMDKCNSPSLVKFLKLHNTNCAETVNRRTLSKKLQERKLQKGEELVQHTGPVCVCCGMTRNM